MIEVCFRFIAKNFKKPIAEEDQHGSHGHEEIEEILNVDEFNEIVSEARGCNGESSASKKKGALDSKL